MTSRPPHVALASLGLAFLLTWLPAAQVAASDGAVAASRQDGAATAQEEDAASPEEVVVFDDIVVTARFVEEDINDVPFTVNVVDAEEIRLNRLLSLDDLFLSVPGVEITSFNDTSNANVRIRGVGAINKTSRDDSSVVIYIDGVPQPIGTSTLGTLDFESVEVLKGPQGTLFGRNSDAGAIQIVTSPAVFENGGYVRAEYGEEAQSRVEGAFNAAVSDKVALRVAGSYRSEDNHIINPNDSEPITTPTSLNARAKLRWDMSDSVALNLTSSHARLRDSPFIYSLHPQTDPPRMDAPPGAVDGDKDIDQWTMRVTANLGGFDFTSISAYDETENRSTGILYEGRLFLPRLGFVPANYGVVNNSFEREFFNQEFRLSSTGASDLFWVAGAHYYDDTSRSASFDYEDPFFFPFVALNADINERDFNTTTNAVFGEITHPLTDRLEFTAGVRHTWEEKDFHIVWAPNRFNPNPLRFVELEQDLSDDYLTGRAALNLHAGERVSLYAIYSRGYKAGGFADRGANVTRGRLDPPYAPSKVNSYELGFKSGPGSGGVLLTGAVYLNDVKDDHIFTFNFFTQETAPENFDTETSGAELELDWRITNTLTLRSGLNYTKAEITGVPANSFARVPVGSRVPNSAHFSGSLALTHVQPLGSSRSGGLELRSHLNYNHLGERFADPANVLLFDAYDRVGLRIGFGKGPREIYFWGDNLLDEDIYMSGIVFNDPASTIARGRRVGLGVSFGF